ncbi:MULTISPECIES: cytochrome P450 [unclassified Streptomyces]|uniref:cytochrome P450 n=1 Tax=unclassified Streptomyces TaxID=2593676 RepID=UPI0036E71129
MNTPPSPARETDPRAVKHWAQGSSGLFAAPPLGPVEADRCFYVHGPDFARRFFHADDGALSHADGWNSVLGAAFGHGMLNLDGRLHDTYRRAVMPLLKRRAVAAYAPHITSAFRRVTTELGGTVDVFPLVRRLVFEISAQILAGIAPRDTEELLEAYIHLQAPRPLGTAEGMRAVQRAVRARHALRASLLAAARRPGGNRDNAVTRLRALDDRPSDLQIAENLSILLLGGYETTGYLLSRMLWLVARHAELQEQLRRGFQREDPLGGQPLFDAVFAETARLHPPLAHLPRRSGVDLNWAGHHIPAGSHVFFSVLTTHHDPALFPEPEKFRIGRFGVGKTEATPPGFALVPFGAGRRICPGVHLATLTSKLITQHFLESFRMNADSDRYVADVTHNGASISPAGPLTIIFSQHRERSSR